jgi:hypothetical protein
MVNPFIRSILLFVSASLLAIVALCQSPSNGPAPRTRSFSGRSAQSAEKNGWTISQGDILVDKVALPDAKDRPRPQFFTVASSQSLWPQVGGVATVYYVNANAGATDPTDEAANANIQTAINIFNADFPNLIQWVPWVSADGPNYVEIDLNAGDFSGECEAAEGYEAVAAQPVGGSAACAVGTILHEMGHVIGLWHEFTRPDRDNYVTVNYNNAIKGSWGNFEILTQNSQTLGLYDYASLMQYPSYSFSRNGGPVIETIPAGMPLGGVEGVPVPATTDYSAGDKEAIERLYGAPPTQVTVTSNPAGLQVQVDGTNMTTPHTFTWALNSTHTLAVASGVQTLTGDIEDSTTSATFYYTYGRWNDNTAQSHTITVLGGDGSTGFPATSPQVATYSANFIELVPYTSSIYPASSGTATISPAPLTHPGISGQFFVARQQATLTARPASGWGFYEFNNGPFWLPGGLGANPKTFYVPDTGNPVDTTVEFTNTPVYNVDITPESFSSSLSVYVDGGFVYTPRNFSAYYDTSWTTGSSHTLTYDSPEYPYSVNSRYAFLSWSDGGAASHSIASLPAASTSYIATVTPQFAPATNFNYPPCGGSGILTPASPTGDGFYPTGQVLSYSATPDLDWTFAGWTYDLTGTTNPANLTAADETLVFANFNTVAAPLTLTGLSPNSADTGGAGVTLTLTGTGFSSTSNVSANGTYRTVTYVNEQTLQVPITTVDLSIPGPFQVFVENYPSGWNGCAVFGYQTFTVHASTLATTTAVSSSSNPAPPGSNVTFTATVTSAEENASGTVTFMDGATVLGIGTVNGAGTATFVTAGLAAGTHSITAVYAGDSNNGGSTSSALTQTVNQAAATMTSPAPGSTFGGTSVTFFWTTVTGASYSLFLGTTGVGSYNLYDSGKNTATSITINGLPTNGATIYARVNTFLSNGTLVHSDYTYTAANFPSASLTAPTPGSTFANTGATFTWTTSPGSTNYELFLGSTGPGSYNVYYSGNLTVTSVAVSGLPVNGEKIYARLYTRFGGTLTYADYTFTAANLPAATLTAPTPGSTFTTTSATFSWTTSSGATNYELFLGSTGPGSYNVFYSGNRTVTTLNVTGLPTNGEKIYARLYTRFNTTLVYQDYTFTATTLPPAALISPTQGSMFTSSSQAFTWNAATGATYYELFLGSTGPGSYNLYYSGHLSVTSVTVNNLPTNGETIYGRLYTNINGTLEYIDYTFTAQ